MTTFLRLELSNREGDITLVNIEHVVRIHPTWPKGCTLVLSDDTSLEQLQGRLLCTGGRAHVYTVEHTYALDHQVDEAYEAMRADLLP
jgi:hypothetical protein